MIILIDQDGTLADFEAGFLGIWKSKFPNRISIPLENRKHPKIYKDYPLEFGDDIKIIHNSPGFISSLKPIDGVIEALKEMVSTGHEVKICTTPLLDFENCVLEKYLWVEKYLGRDFTKNIILTRDKTLIKGDFLIDDNPGLRGIMKPDWEQIIFDRPYNKDFQGKRLKNWAEWKPLFNL